VTDYVEALEEVMLRICSEWGLRTGRNDLNRGLWAGPRKIGSIGIAVRHGITFHGLALNVNLSMEPFGWIQPCGLRDVAMTSMAAELGEEIPMDRVRTSAKIHFQEVFGVNLCDLRHGALRKWSPGKNALERMETDENP
jgi:lipoate-protein ligase B